MKAKVYKITIQTLSSFNICTGAKNNGYIKELSIRNFDGKPYIPGSTIKGLLRDNYRKFEENDSIVNIIFGSEDNPSKIVVEDMILSENEYKSLVKFGNAVDRHRKVVVDNALYSKEIISGIFQGEIKSYIDDETINDNLELAIKMIKSLGSSKSSGLGKIEICVSKEDKEEKEFELQSKGRFMLDFQSPVLIGKHRKNSNFIECDDVIKGSVIRAAFAKKILENCPEREESYKDGKKNWVFYRNKPSCVKCNLKKTCMDFSKMKFSYFYPKETEAIPLSQKICKKNEEHGYINDLIENSNVGCKKCREENREKLSRVEFKSGLRYKNDKKTYDSDLKKCILTKNSINPYTKTAEDGMLYSVQVISSTHIENGENKIQYEGKIHGIHEDEIKYFSNLRVGGDTTVGFGKCSLISLEENSKEIDITESIEKFSTRFKMKKIGNLKEKKNYIAIKLTSDCKLNFDFKGEYIKTEALKKLWKKILLDNIKYNNNLEDLEIEKIYTELNIYRGYDNSLSTKNKREEAFVLASKGTVILFCSEKKSITELIEVFKEIEGFGEEQENGFGEFEIFYEGIE